MLGLLLLGKEKPDGVNRRAGIRFVIGPTGWRRVRSDCHANSTIRSSFPRAKLCTLRDAATYVTGLPKKETALPEWQAAIEALMLVADRGGPTMFARIGVMRALNRHVERVFDPSRKETQAQTRAIDEAGSRQGRSMSRWRHWSNWLWSALARPSRAHAE